MLRAAVVLFGRSDRLLPDYPQCELRVARFRGTDRTEFLDNRQFHGHAFDLLTRAERFLRENLPIAGRVLPDLFERRDDPLYPPAALREALANGFCHRDYAIGGGSVAAAIYDDRLEITSSGPLHFGLSVEDLLGPHESLLWNPLIAGVFFRRGVIEHWGRGTVKIRQQAVKAGLPPPQFEEYPGAVVVRFLPSEYLPPRQVRHDLTERQQRILALLGRGPRLPLRTIHERVGGGATRRSLRKDLAFLKSLNLIERPARAAGPSGRFPRAINRGRRLRTGEPGRFGPIRADSGRFGPIRADSGSPQFQPRRSRQHRLRPLRLQHHHLRVPPAAGHQFLVGAGFEEAAVF